jgi:hypothetical protein
MNEPNWSPPDSLKAIRSKAWIVGSLGAGASAIGFLAQRQQFFQSYLVAWVFWISITLGCLAIMMLQHLTRGGWGLMVRRTLEAATRTLPLLTILFLPILLGLEDIYVWARPEAANDPLIQHKASYLNPTAFAIRSLVYLGIWTFFAWALSRLSLKQDQTGDPGLSRRMQVYSAPGLVVFSLLATFASIDWLMSLDPHWYSSIFGVYFIIGSGVAGFAFVSIVALYLSQRQPLAGRIQPKHFHDYGKLLLAFVMLWAYMGVSQLLIIWSGNLPEEVPWYLHRVQGGWKWVSISLVLLHFVLPFVLLLSRDFKRNARFLAGVSLMVLLMRWVDLYWLAAPTFHHHPAGHWLDIATMAGIGGIWVAVFVGQLASRPLLPVNDPDLEEALAHD